LNPYFPSKKKVESLLNFKGLVNQRDVTFDQIMITSFFLWKIICFGCL